MKRALAVGLLLGGLLAPAVSFSAEICKGNYNNISNSENAANACSGATGCVGGTQCNFSASCGADNYCRRAINSGSDEGRWGYFESGSCPAGQNPDANGKCVVGATQAQKDAARVAAQTAAQSEGFNAVAVTAAGDAAVDTLNSFISAGKTLAEAQAAAVTAAYVAARESVYSQNSGLYTSATAALTACVSAGRSGCENSFATYDAALISGGLKQPNGYEMRSALPNGTTRQYLQGHNGVWQVYDYFADGSVRYMGDQTTLLPFGTANPTAAFGDPTGTGASSATRALTNQQTISPSAGAVTALVSRDISTTTIRYFDGSGLEVARAVESAGGTVAVTGTGASGLNVASDFAVVRATGAGVTSATVSESGTPTGSGSQDAGKAALDAVTPSSLGVVQWDGKGTSMWGTFPSISGSSSCENPTAVFFGKSVTVDICSVSSPMKGVLAWILYLFTALYMWRRVHESVR